MIPRSSVATATAPFGYFDASTNGFSFSAHSTTGKGIARLIIAGADSRKVSPTWRVGTQVSRSPSTQQSSSFSESILASASTPKGSAILCHFKARLTSSIRLFKSLPWIGKTWSSCPLGKGPLIGWRITPMAHPKPTAIYGSSSQFTSPRFPSLFFSGSSFATRCRVTGTEVITSTSYVRKASYFPALSKVYACSISIFGAYLCPISVILVRHAASFSLRP